MRLESNASYIPPMRMLFPVSGVLMSVRTDDPVYAIQETYGMRKDGTGDNRYQALIMARGNSLSAFWTDLGPAEDYRMTVGDEVKLAPPYFQPILQAHTVDECRDMADVGRMDDFASRLLAQRVEESTLFAEYARIVEEDQYIVRNRSTFGYGGKTQRAGYSRVAAALREGRN